MKHHKSDPSAVLSWASTPLREDVQLEASLDPKSFPWPSYLKAMGLPGSCSELAGQYQVTATMCSEKTAKGSKQGEGIKGAVQLQVCFWERDQVLALIIVHPVDPARRTRKIEANCPGGSSPQESSWVLLQEQHYFDPLPTLPSQVKETQAIGALALDVHESAEGVLYAFGARLTLDGKHCHSWETLASEQGQTSFLSRLFDVIRDKGAEGYTVYLHGLSQDREGYFILLAAAYAISHPDEHGGQWSADLQTGTGASRLPMALSLSYKKKKGKGPKRQIVLKDSWSLLQSPLEEIAKHIPEQAGEPSGPAWKCLVTWAAMAKRSEALWDAFQLNMTNFTSGSGIAMAHYQIRHLALLQQGMPKPKSLLVLPSSSLLYKAIRAQSYKGGIVVAPGLEQSRGKVYKQAHAYDVNSIYPHCIASTPMPGGSFTYVKHIDLSDPEAFGWVQALARAPRGRVPCLLPLDDREDHTGPLDEGGVRFTGHDELVYGLFYVDEVREAMRQGYQVETYGGIQCERVEDAFTSYVHTLHESRRRYKLCNEEGLQQATKLILNALYGRLAIRASFENVSIKGLTEVKLQKGAPTPGPDLKVYTPEGQHLATFNSGMVSVGSEVATSLPVAAAITATARVVISQYMNLKGRKLLYSDTDSVLFDHPFTPQQKADFVSESGELGKLKYECHIEQLTLLKSKWYSYLPKGETVPVVKASGVSIENPAHARQVAGAFSDMAKGKRETVVLLNGPRLTMEWQRGRLLIRRHKMLLRRPWGTKPQESSNLNAIRYQKTVATVPGLLLQIPLEVHACIADPGKLPKHLQRWSQPKG